MKLYFTETATVQQNGSADMATKTTTGTYRDERISGT